MLQAPLPSIAFIWWTICCIIIMLHAPRWIDSFINYAVIINLITVSDCRAHFHYLTRWGQVMHTCVSKLTIIDSDNGLSPGRHQAIIWTNAGMWLIRTLGTNCSEILSKIHICSFKKMRKCRLRKWPFCLHLNVLRFHDVLYHTYIGCKCMDSGILTNRH